MDEPTAPGAVLRPTVRILLIDAQERVLLFQMHAADGRVFWCPPGGGVEGDETPEDAALRELREETGWGDPSIGPLIGHRRHVVTWNDGITYDSRERWYLAHVDALDVDDAGWTEDERRDMGRHHWWTLAELRDAEEPLAPGDLADRVREILVDGAPGEPWQLGL